MVNIYSNFEVVKDEELDKYKIEKDKIILPNRKTTHSAGYDIYLAGPEKSYDIKPKEKILLPTGIKCRMHPNRYLSLSLKSGIANKYTILLCNSPGIIDADYYNNPDNDGHIFILLYNYGDEYIKFDRNKGIMQGIFLKYKTIDNEKKVETKRIGGIGSTI